MWLFGVTKIIESVTSTHFQHFPRWNSSSSTQYDRNKPLAESLTFSVSCDSRLYISCNLWVASGGFLCLLVRYWVPHGPSQSCKGPLEFYGSLNQWNALETCSAFVRDVQLRMIFWKCRNSFRVDSRNGVSLLTCTVFSLIFVEVFEDLNRLRKKIPLTHKQN